MFFLRTYLIFAVLDCPVRKLESNRSNSSIYATSLLGFRCTFPTYSTFDIPLCVFSCFHCVTWKTILRLHVGHAKCVTHETEVDMHCTNPPKLRKWISQQHTQQHPRRLPIHKVPINPFQYIQPFALSPSSAYSLYRRSNDIDDHCFTTAQGTFCVSFVAYFSVWRKNKEKTNSSTLGQTLLERKQTFLVQ